MIVRAGWQQAPGFPPWLACEFDVDAPIAIDVDVTVSLHDARGTALWTQSVSGSGRDTPWLPTGRYRTSLRLEPFRFPAGSVSVEFALSMRVKGERQVVSRVEGDVPAGVPVGAPRAVWHLESLDGTTPVEQLAWFDPANNWFSQHFDHASRTCVEYLGAGSPAWRGRVLDAGCGDGITALGIALRYAPEQVVGIDPNKCYDVLPGILERHALGHLAQPSNLQFMPADANDLPFADSSFDAIVSWSAVEHFVGGYLPSLAEARRVLKPGGLLVIHPELYYTAHHGHHLGEYSKEPFFHLVKSHDQVREIVLGGEQKLHDRGGIAPTREEHWKWYNELNRITAPQFEDELRALDFEPWRLALRAEPLVEYRPELLNYRFTDLGINELYVACINRK